MAKVSVDKNKCTGCGLCSTNCPNVFALAGDKSKVKAKDVKDADLECAKKAAADCPSQAITVK
jgi:ferredoxin